jgi:hypothetical protein
MRKLIALFLIVGFALMFAAPSDAAIKSFWANVYKMDYLGQSQDSMTRYTSGIQFKVLQRNSDTAETLYEFPDMDDTLTSLTNPVTAANFANDAVCKDRVAFQVDPGEATDTYVDLIVVDNNGGYTAFVEDFTVNEHTIIIDARPGIVHHGMVWFGASDNTATDTGVDFLPDTFIKNVLVEIVTVDNTETLNVGTVDTAAGFLSAVSLNTGTEGYVDPRKATVTTGSSATYVSTASKIGSLLGSSVVGSSGNTDNGSQHDWGHIVKTSGTDDDLYYTGSAGSDTAAGYIHYFFVRMR